jgi:hypothetical protein
VSHHRFGPGSNHECLAPGAPVCAHEPLDHSRDPQAHRATGVLSMAGGLPSADLSGAAIRAACDKVLRDAPREARSTPPARGSHRCASGSPSTCGCRAWRSSPSRC